MAIEEVAYAYGRRQALDRVSFTIPPGRFAVLLGLNGAGKSTLFQLITRLFATRQGTIRIFGHDVLREAGAALRRLGVVFQARTLDLDLTVRQNLAYHAALHGIGRSAAKMRAAEVLARVDLAGRVSERARNLSGGQMRRLEIARALLHQPRLILLDEPTVGLDIAARADILAHVRDLVANDGVAVLWATHLVDEIAQDDQVLVLHQGRLLADGRLDALLASTGAGDAETAFRRLIERPGAVP
ncbi:ABC transporter ATP-binding protein [Geminicoccus harenae]|uniref:ABC transporter ATP-binding protein n=1 Tax=Geminicoccus harenae TaxID=2498453 RepID=UPI001CC31DD6|nr:ABC transporter ATP-binding protein [Geminicoccus harenae]